MFPSVISFESLKNLMKYLLVFLFYMWWIGGSEKLTNFPRATQEGSLSATLWSQISWLQILCFFHYFPLKPEDLHALFSLRWFQFFMCGSQRDRTRAAMGFFFFLRFYFSFFSPKPPVHSCIFLVVGASSCGMWDTTSAWPDVSTQDSNQRNTGPTAAEHTNLTTRPQGQPLCWIFLKK